jgi:hypothetical protein
MNVAVTVGSAQGTTPFNLSLSPGQYTVVYGAVSWFRTPPPRSVAVLGGVTAFALGTYTPIIKTVAITASGFNSTSVSALHGVTPVVWLNHGGSVAVLEIQNVGRFEIAPSQNTTMVFTSKGTFSFTVFGTNFEGYVLSS